MGRPIRHATVKALKPGGPRRLSGLLSDRFSVLESSSPTKGLSSRYESSVALRWHLSNRFAPVKRSRWAPSVTVLAVVVALAVVVD